MKLKLTECPELPELEVEIRYAKLTSQVQSLAKKIAQSEKYLHGEEGGRQYRILVDDIFYIESMERKTFIYTDRAIFRAEQKLYQLLDMLQGTDFVQVSKSCIVNINVIDSMQSLANSRLQATLANGEKVNVSRTFLPQIKAAFTGKEND